jgi:hypothetical protein
MPVTPAIQILIDQWNAKVKEMAPLKAKIVPLAAEEQALRRLIVHSLWPANANEGTRYEELATGQRLKGNVKIDRKVDEAAYQNNHERIWKELGNPQTFFKTEHSLDLKAYRALPAEKQKILQEIFVEKPASPELELLPPKEG